MLLATIPSISTREFLTSTHGMILGGLFLLTFSGGVVAMLGLKSQDGMQLRMLRVWVVGQAIIAWLATVTGAFIVYPWYRAKPPAGADLREYPQQFLMKHPDLSAWHSLGMEWKEHVAWFSPILATCVAYLVVKFGTHLAENRGLRSACLVLYCLAFGCAAVAGLFGAEITKAAAIR